MITKPQSRAIWAACAVLAPIILYFAAAWLMWRAHYFFPSGPLANVGVMILFNDYAGYDSSIWKPAYAVFRCFSEEPEYFKTLF